MEILNRSLAVWRWPRGVAALALAFSLASCSPGASVSVTLTPASVDLVAGTSVEVVVSVSRSGSAADLTLSATGVPSGVTATFAPSTLAAAVQSSTLTLVAEPDTDLGASTITVTATGAGVSASKELAVAVTSLKVEGLVQGSFGEPIAGATVVIDGHGSTLTAADGTFVIEDVAVPYRLTVLNAAAQWAHTFEGMTAAAPSIFPLTALSATPAVPTATISGDLDAVVAPDHQTVICVEGISQAVFGCDTVNPSFSSYSIAAQWREGGSADVRLRAIEYSLDPVTSEPVAITGASASAVFALTEGGAAAVDLVVGGPVAPATFNVNLTTSFTADSYTAVALTHLSENFTLGIAGWGVATPSFSIFAPFFSNSQYTVAAGASNAAGASSIQWRTGVGPGANLDFHPPIPPALTLPADGATGVDHDTDFSVGNPAGGVLTFQFAPLGSGPSYAVTTVGTTVSIPDLSTFGLALPAAFGYNWSVFGNPEVTDMAAAVTGPGYIGTYVETALALSYGGPAPSADGVVSLSQTHDFVTP